MNTAIFKHSIIKFFNYLIILSIISYLSYNDDKNNLSTYFYLLNLINLSVIFINYGFSHSSQDLIPKIFYNKSSYDLNTILITHLNIIIINSFLFIFVYLSLTKNFYLSFILFFCLVIFSILFFLSDTLRALNKPYIGQIAIYNILVLFNLLLIILFNKYLKLSDLTFVLVFIISSFISLIFLINFFLKKNLSIKFELLNLKKIFKYYKKNFFNTFNSFSHILITYIFTIVLYYEGTSNDVINYNLAFLFSSFIGLPLFFLNINFARQLSLLVDKKDDISIQKFAKKMAFKSSNLSIILFIITYITLSFFSDLIFNNNFDNYKSIFIIISIAILINSTFGPNQIYLIVKSKSKLLSLINISVLSFLCFIFLFFFQFSAINCALFFLSYQILINLIIFITIYKRYKISIFYF